MIFETDDYRSFLRAQLLERMKKDPTYSLRTFSKELRIDHSSLSQILAGKRNLSAGRSFEVAHYLNLNSKEAECFVSLVRLRSAKNVNKQAALRSEIQERFKGSVLQTRDLQVEEFLLLSDWRNFAILQFLRLHPKGVAALTISKRLNLNTAETTQALERLSYLKIVEEKKEKNEIVYIRIREAVLFKTKVAHEGLKKFYSDTLDLVKKASQNDAADTRVAGTKFIALSQNGLEKARKITEEYFQKLGEISDQDERNSMIYVFSAHAARVDKSGKKSKVATKQKGEK